MGAAPVELLLDDEVLTQYGTEGQPFRRRPRGRESDVSLLRGRLDPAEAATYVRGAQGLGPGVDCVRTTTVGHLRDAGFVVEHTPALRNAIHVSVKRDGDWDDDLAVAFDTCFARR